MAASGSGGTLLTSASMSSRLTLGSCEVLVSLGVNAYRARRTAPDATMAGKRNVLMGGKDNKNISAARRFGMASATEGSRFEG